MYEPVGGFSPVLVNHHVNVRGATGVVTRVDGGDLHYAIRVGVPTTTKEGLLAVKCIGTVPAIIASCVG